MMQRWFKVLGRVDSRAMGGVMLILIGLLIVEAWLLLLRAPFVDYRQLRATHRAIAAAVTNAPRQLDDMGRVASELKLLTDKLSGQLHIRASDNEMAAALMSALDQSATPHGIALSSMKPGERKQVSVFEEVSFAVGGTGSYLELCQWMLDLEQALGNSATISEFDMKTAGESGQVVLSFNIALYRPLKLTEGSL
jgi:Tfp pilus assembly protein PilO